MSDKKEVKTAEPQKEIKNEETTSNAADEFVAGVETKLEGTYATKKENEKTNSEMELLKAKLNDFMAKSEKSKEEVKEVKADEKKEVKKTPSFSPEDVLAMQQTIADNEAKYKNEIEKLKQSRKNMSNSNVKGNDSETFIKTLKELYELPASEKPIKSIDLSGTFGGIYPATENYTQITPDTQLRSIFDLLPRFNIDSVCDMSFEQAELVGGSEQVIENGLPNELEYTFTKKTAYVLSITDWFEASTFLGAGTTTLERFLNNSLSKFALAKDNMKRKTNAALVSGARTDTGSFDGLMSMGNTLPTAALSFIAGDIASIATHDGGNKTIVTFAANHDIRTDAGGGNAVIGGSANYTAVAGYDWNWYNMKQIVLDAPYVAEATAAWTVDIPNKFDSLIQSANEYDVLDALLTRFRDLGFDTNKVILFLNSADSLKLRNLKDTTNNRLFEPMALQLAGVYKLNNGMILYETDAVSKGQFLSLVAHGAVVDVHATKDTTVTVFTKEADFVIRNVGKAVLANMYVIRVHNPNGILQGDFASLKSLITI